MMRTLGLLLLVCLLHVTCATPEQDCAAKAESSGDGVYWMIYEGNCHKSVVCTIQNGRYTVSILNCGHLFWNQGKNTCVEYIPSGVDCGPESMIMRVCDNRAFLKFEFNGNFVDSSCTKATAHVAHGNVGFITSPYGKAATFNGNAYMAIPTMTGMFMGNYMNDFSISMFVRIYNTKGVVILFENGDMNQRVSILLGYTAFDQTLTGFILVSGWDLKPKPIVLNIKLREAPVNVTHVAYVYHNGRLKITINGEYSEQAYVYGYNRNVNYSIDNINEPLVIGGTQTHDFFLNGTIDEFRVFKTSISSSDVVKLSQNIY